MLRTLLIVLVAFSCAARAVRPEDVLRARGWPTRVVHADARRFVFCYEETAYVFEHRGEEAVLVETRAGCEGS